MMLHGDGDNTIIGNTNIVLDGLTIANTTVSYLYIGTSEGVSLGDVNYMDAYDYTLRES